MNPESKLPLKTVIDPHTKPKVFFSFFQLSESDASDVYRIVHVGNEIDENPWRLVFNSIVNLKMIILTFTGPKPGVRRGAGTLTLTISSSTK